MFWRFRPQGAIPDWLLSGRPTSQLPRGSRARYPAQRPRSGICIRLTESLGGMRVETTYAAPTHNSHSADHLLQCFYGRGSQLFTRICE